MEAHGDEYEQVLCTDTRDVIFQGDVFASFKNQSAYLGYTTEYDDIRGSKTGATLNYRWLVQYFNQEEADKLADKQIICCGTVLGTVNEMKLFLQIFVENMRIGYGADQVTQQYIMYHNLLPIENQIEIDCDSGEILTFGLFHMRHALETRDDKILRGDGGVPAIVHQYDHKPELIRFVDEIYRDKNFHGDPNFSDVHSLLEQTNYLLQADKFDDAARFYMSKLPAGATFDDNIERLLKIWQLVLQRPTTPAVGYLELAVQDALMSVQNFPLQHLGQICALLIHSIKNQRTILPQFKILIYNGLVNIVEQTIQINSAEQCFDCLKIIKELTVPLDKNFYLLAAKANRIFGRNDEALAAYIKALKLG